MPMVIGKAVAQISKEDSVTLQAVQYMRAPSSHRLVQLGDLVPPDFCDVVNGAESQP